MSSKTECYFDEEEYVCPLCMEEMDISDRNFRPCPCGYQVNYLRVLEINSIIVIIINQSIK